MHCCLATGGPGAAMRHAPFGRPRHPLGTFPCGKVPRPPAGGRNLPQETDFLWKARERPSLLLPVLRRVSPLRRRPKGFPIALWKPSGPCCKGVAQKNRFLVEGKGKTFLTSSCVTEGFASAEATKGLSDRPLETFGPLLQRGGAKKQIPCGRQGKDLPYFFLCYRGFRLCGGDQRAFRSPFGNLRALAAHGGFHKKQIPCGRQEKSLPCFILFRGKFRLCGGHQGAFRSPPGPLRGSVR